MLLKLAQEAQSRNEILHTACISVKGELLEKISKLRRPESLLSLCRSLASPSSRVLVCWMYKSCLLGAFLKVFFPKTVLVWNVRHSLTHLAEKSFRTRLIIRVLAHLSWMPDKIIFNSWTSKEQHSKLWKIPETKSEVVPNGFNSELFVPDPKSAATNRVLWGASREDFVMGLYGRFNPVKGHHWFIEALGKVPAGLSYKLILIGERTDSSEMRQLTKSAGIEKNCVFIGKSQAMQSEYPGIDCLVVPSLSESFPNVIGEAMLCGIKIIATSVGDNKLVIKSHGITVPVGDAIGVRNAIFNIRNQTKWDAPDLGARQSIVDRFSIQSIFDQYQSLNRL